VLQASCADCDKEPAQREYWGCESADDGQVRWIEDLNEDEYYACPIRFIPQSVYEWYAEYSYYKQFPGAARPYERISNKFVEASNVYERAYNEYMVIVRGQTARK
jgi:hypothetical protein